MITDSQIKQFLDSMWEEYFDHISDKEFPHYADKGTCMMFEFEDFIQDMSFLDMSRWLEDFTPDNYDTDNFDKYDWKLIKAAGSNGTDIIIKLMGSIRYA